MCDDNYLVACKTMIYSFLCNNDYFNGKIFIICNDLETRLSQNSRQELMKLYDNIEFIEINKEEYKDGIENCKKYTEEKFVPCFYKFELFKNYGKFKKILWLDSDTIVDKSIKELFDDYSESAFCLDYFGGSSYYNAGVFCITRNSLKVEDPFQFLMNVMRNADYDFFKNSIGKRRGLYADQDILNNIMPELFKSIVQIPVVYNLNQILEHSDDATNAKIIHYCGYPKPFVENEFGKRNIHSIWKRYYDEMMEKEKALD
jgi:lipopolysaccharide biosynthesis glycosyltransferase